MSGTDIQAIISEVESLLLGDEISASVEKAIGLLLNVVEALNDDKQSLAAEVDQLRKLVDQKKKAKTTGENDDQTKPPGSDHSSEKRRRKLGNKKRKQALDRRSHKNLTIHETIECPIDPASCRALKDYRAGPDDELAKPLRLEFDELFSTYTH